MTHSYKYFDLLAMAFVATLLISNTVAAKLIQIGPLSLPGGVLLFPVAYICGDLLTEVYGFRPARRVVWGGLLATLFMSGCYIIVGNLPAPNFWTKQNEFDAILGQVPRIVIASAVAYFVGEYTNSVVLAKMKVMTKGKWLWARTLGSTVIGQALDTGLFVLIAFTGIFPADALIAIALSNYLVKVGYEVALLPVIYAVVRFLKREENLDHFDVDTSFNPLPFKN